MYYRRIRDLREDSDLTQTQIADAAIVQEKHLKDIIKAGSEPLTS